LDRIVKETFSFYTSGEDKMSEKLEETSPSKLELFRMRCKLAGELGELEMKVERLHGTQKDREEMKKEIVVKEVELIKVDMALHDEL